MDIKSIYSQFAEAYVETHKLLKRNHINVSHEIVIDIMNLAANNILESEAGGSCAIGFVQEEADVFEEDVIA